MPPPSCAINIGPRETRKRLLIGRVSLIVGVLSLAILVVFRIDPYWRLALFVPWFVGVLAWLEAREKT